MEEKNNRLLNEMLFWRECKEYGVSVWACPTFLFVLMGTLTISAILATYFIGQKYTDIEIVLPVVFLVALAIFVPGSIIVQSFEKMAAANKMKTEFVSIASHQLRSPSAAIKWSLSALMKEKDNFSDKQKEYLEMIVRHNEQMIKMVNDLLNVSRIEKGNLFLKEEEVDVEKLVQKILSSLEPVAQAKGIKLNFTSKDGHGFMVLGDEIYIGMIITNFIDNAVRYSSKGDEVNIKILATGENVRFEVEDHGLGIPEKEQKLIFQKFFRSQNAIKKENEGTGLGLFIAKGVVDKMHGQIGFDSKEEEGSTFWFELPLVNKS